MSKEIAAVEVSKELMFDPQNLTKDTIKKFLCPTATDQELTLGLQIAKSFQLNPLKREVYFVKYGNNPMSVLTGYEVYIKRAERSGKYAGMKAWTEGSVEKKDLKGCVEVYVKGWDKPLVHEVDYVEYVQLKSDGSINKFWKTKPKTMIKKVAIGQGFRLAFPDEMDGMPYTDAEMDDPEIITVDTGKSRLEGIIDAETTGKQLPEVLPEKVKKESLKKHEESVIIPESVPLNTVELKEGEKLAQGFIINPPKVANVEGADGKPAVKHNFSMADVNYGTFDKDIAKAICDIIDNQNKDKSQILLNVVYKDRAKNNKVFHDIVRFEIATLNDKALPI